MDIKVSTRKQTKMRLTIIGEDNTGKTVSALMAAYGLCGDWRKVCIIDTEEGSISSQSHLGIFNTIQVRSYSIPDSLEKAILLCEQSDIEVIIIDSVSSEWIGPGSVRDIYMSTPGTDTDKYKEAMMHHNAFMESLLGSSCHIIVTVRMYGMKPVQSKTFTWNFLTVLQLDEQCKARVLKDKTGLFTSIEPFVITPETGALMHNWCIQGTITVDPNLQEKIDNCSNIRDLVSLMYSTDVDDPQVMAAFIKRRAELQERQAQKLPGEVQLSVVHTNL